MLSSVTLLGPQRHVPIVRPVVDELLPEGGHGPLAVVTAGWEEREGEDQELRDHLQRPVRNLEVWARVERIFERDRELLQAMRQRHDTLRRVQALYRLRLQGLMDSLKELYRRSDDPELLEPERRDALVMLQGLDDQHVARVAQIHAEFEDRWRPAARETVVQEREAIRRILAAAPVLLVAGGHVGVLLHRLRLFDVFGLHGDRPLIAWSAGAMAVCPRIVLFHDAPPQGSAHAEVMEAGCELVPEVVVLPHARKRLHTHDEAHLCLLAQRFAPSLVALLDDGSRLDWRQGRWAARTGTQRVCDTGRLLDLGVA